MELGLMLQNNLNSEKQNKFLEGALGKAINLALDVGLQMLLPDGIEDAVIGVKNTILKEGVSGAIGNVIDIGKRALGMQTENMQNISEVKSVIEKGGIINEASKLVDTLLKNAEKNNMISTDAIKAIKSGKNILVDNIKMNIQNTLEWQDIKVEDLNKYCKDWTSAYKAQNLTKMESEFNKIQKTMEIIVPLENCIKKAKEIENLHNVIKSKGSFELTEDELNLTKKLP